MREIFSLIVFLPILYWCIFIKNQDKFCPKNIVSILYLFSIAIPTFTIGWYEHLSISLPTVFTNACKNDVVFIEYIILQVICYFLIIAGLNFNIRLLDKKRLTSNNKDKKIDISKLRIIALFLFLIGLMASVYFIQTNGGFVFFLNNLRFRTVFLRESGFVKWFIPLTSYGTLIYIYTMKWQSKREVLLCVLLIVLSGLCTGMGGRKALIILIIEAMMIYNYKVKHFRIKDFISLKYMVIFILLYIFMSGYKIMRNPEALDYLFNDPISFIEESNTSFLEILLRESYVSHYLGVIEYFKDSDYWLGSSFSGFVYAFVPSFIFPSKPPVDDGMYLYSIALGRKDIFPVMPYNELNGSSLPLETFGSMYANFGYIGLFVGMILLGIIIGLGYRYMYTKSFNFTSVILYTNMVFGFHLSTLRIVQLLILIIMLFSLDLMISSYSKIRFRIL